MFNYLKNNVWHDYSLEKIVIQYNDIIVELTNDEEIYILTFENYIAFDYIGQWDENIVETIYTEKNNDIIDNALKRINSNNGTIIKGGGRRDIDSDWVCVVVKLIDGVCIRIACDNLVIEKEIGGKI